MGHISRADRYDSERNEMTAVAVVRKNRWKNMTACVGSSRTCETAEVKTPRIVHRYNKNVSTPLPTRVVRYCFGFCFCRLAPYFSFPWTHDNIMSRLREQPRRRLQSFFLIFLILTSRTRTIVSSECRHGRYKKQKTNGKKKHKKKTKTNQTRIWGVKKR